MSSNETREIRVLCVDDDADVAGAIEAMINDEAGMSCAECVHDPDHVVAAISRSKPDVVLLDLSLPGVDTIALIRKIVAEHANSRVLVYSGYDQPEIVEEVLGVGAWGLVSKHGRFDELMHAIRRVSRGETVSS